MRVTVLILGLLLGLAMLIQTLAVYGLSSATDQETMSEAGAVGLFMAVIWLAACAFVLPLPMVSVVLFIFAGVLGFGVGLTSDFVDLAAWGGVSFFLALLAFFGWMGKRKDRREKRAEQVRQTERDDRVETLLRQQRDQANYPRERPAETVPKSTMTFPTSAQPASIATSPGSSSAQSAEPR